MIIEKNQTHEASGEGHRQKTKDNLFINHILLVGKQYIYNCRCTKTNPCLRVFLARLNDVYQLETIIAKSKNEMSFHLSKWQAILTSGTQFPINIC